MVKRMEKTEARLEAINNGYLPSKDDHNHTVRRLYNEPSSASPQPVTSMEHFGRILGQLGNVSSVLGIIYSLLSWEIFRWEEERLIHNEGQALIMAAKRV
jgi:hypothetical protein